MRHYIFGFDAANPEQCADRLAQKGIDAVVVGDADARTVRALSARGIGLYLCFGAHGVSGAFDSPAHLCMDSEGNFRKWFSSGCPNDRTLADARLREALDRVGGDVRGVFVDGARFASFASQEGAEAFFTCFCPRCMSAMTSMGLDADAIRAAVARLRRSRACTEDDLPLLRGWLAFRERCVQAYFDRFANAVHALRSDLAAGAFVFTPSLSAFVGQTSRACRSLELVAPMIYRHYRPACGPATLNHEWAGLGRLFSENAQRFASLGSAPADAAARPHEVILRDGFPPEFIGREVAAARRALLPGQRLVPILQIDDPLRPDSLRAALDAKADGVGWFVYGQAEL